MSKHNFLNCNNCGKFVALADLINDKAIHRLVTPLSDYTKEEYETLCYECYIKEKEGDA